MLLGLCHDVLRETLVVRHHGAGKHEVLPHQNSFSVTRDEEGIRRVHATTPNAHHVHVRSLGVGDNVAPTFVGMGLVEIWGDDIRPLGMHGSAVDVQAK